MWIFSIYLIEEKNIFWPSLSQIYWECNKKSHMGVFDAHKSLFLSNSCLTTEIYWRVQASRVRWTIGCTLIMYSWVVMFALHFILRCYFGTTSASHIDRYTLRKCIYHLILTLTLTLTNAKSHRCEEKDEFIWKKWSDYLFCKW